MKLTHERPHVKAWCKDGSQWMLPLLDWEPFLATWMKGEAWWRGSAANGADVCFRLADITGAVRCDASWCDREENEEEERKRRKLTEGE